MSEPVPETSPVPERSFARAAAGWAVLLVLLGYAGFVHHGLGPVPDGTIEVYSPREFLLAESWIEPFEERPGLGVLAFAAPAVLLAVGVFVLTASAVARTLAVAGVVASILFAFYGLRPPGPGIWRFFGWRGSGVMAGLALVIAATSTAPLLARSWLRLPTWGRVLVYLPVFLLVVVLLRNVTGTDPTLRFAISPWPVVPLFGMTIGSVAILGLLAGMTAAAFAFTHTGGLRIAGIAVGLLLPAVWFKLWHGTVPDAGLGAITAVAAACIAAALLSVQKPALKLRARGLAWGTILAAAPLLAGEALASFDYSRTREGSAREIITALDAYYAKHEEYPEELAELVDGGYIEAIPQPSIGFSAFGGEQEFAYQSFGISYNLEFSAPDWVQCAYNPAWAEEDWEEEEEEAEAEADEADDPSDEEHSLEESWSCPSSPPELW